MNELSVLKSVRTMDSREIAELTGKEHSNVCRDIRAMLEAAGKDQITFESIFRDTYGRNQRCYLLPAHELMLLLTGYSVPLRDKVLRRWEELEHATAPSLPDFADPVAAARAWADEVEAKRKAEGALAAAQPKIECAEALMASERTMSITDAAKHFGLHPKTEVFPYLRARGYLTASDLPTQAAIDAGYLSLKETKDRDGKVWPQAVVEAWQLETWRAHVVRQIKAWLHERAAA